MSATRTAKRWFSLSNGAKRSRRRLLLLEGLEDRTVLSPTIYTVNTWGDSPSDPHTATTGDLRYCIQRANANTSNPAGSVIQFDPTVFDVGRTISLGGGSLTLSNTTTVTSVSGPGSSLLTVSGGGASSNFSVFTVNTGATAIMSGLTISNGNTSGNGGGVWNMGNVTLSSDTLSGNSANYGGGMLNIGTATLTNVNVSGNSAAYGGGIYSYSATLTLTNDVVSGNSASNQGGGINNYSGFATLTNVTISGNSAGYSGGGVWNNVGGTATLTTVTLSNNSASIGGGLYNGSPATLTDVVFTGNTAPGASGYGGGIYNFHNLLALSNATFTDNSAGVSGGGICNDVNGSVTLNNVTLDGNSATATSSYGGGIYNGNSTVTLANVTLAGNSASTCGGGIVNNGTATLTNVRNCETINYRIRHSVDSGNPS
jgi:predicted outer membrane repeat protein